MTTPSADTIKEQVREHYGAIAEQAARGAASSCCSPTVEVVSLVDYGDLASNVVSGSDLGLGCGAPTLAADLRPGQTVLDLGSGAGIDVFLAARAVGPAGRVIGVDMTPAMLARAQANAEKGGFSNVEFRQGEIEHLPVDDASIDVVLSNCVINLVPDKGQAFREVYRVLRPGGRFSISDIVTYGQIPEALRNDLTLWAECITGALDREDYLGLIRAAGFRDVRVETETTYDAAEVGAGLESAGLFGIASVTVVGEK